MTEHETPHPPRALTRTLTRRVVTLSLAAALAVSATACGSDSATVDESASEQTSEQPADTAGNGADLAFVSQMIPHHQSAVEMAEIAEKQAERDELRTLASDIIEAQTAEITTLEALKSDLEAANIEEGDLGISDDMAGMNMDSGMLKTADPFDREFIDMMIGHHQGAIRMARAEMTDGANPQAQRLAEEVIAAQTREIEQMNEWRKEWYGETSPAGGVPAEDEAASEEHSGGH